MSICPPRPDTNRRCFAPCPVGTFCKCEGAIIGHLFGSYIGGLIERNDGAPIGGCLAVYHNLCGRRTVHKCCGCKTCRSLGIQEAKAQAMSAGTAETPKGAQGDSPPARSEGCARTPLGDTP